MSAGFCRRVVGIPPDDWAQSREGRDDRAFCKPGIREDRVDRLEYVGDFFVRAKRLPNEREGMVEIGRAEDSASFPGDREHRPTVFGMREGHGMRDWQVLEAENEVGAAQGSHPPLPTELRAQFVGPGSGGVDDRSGFKLQRAQASPGSVLHCHAADAGIGGSEQPYYFRVVQGNPAPCLSFLDQAQNHSAVIQARVVVKKSALHPFWFELWDHLL